MKKEFEADLVSIVVLAPRTKMLTVLVHQKKQWPFFRKFKTIEKKFIYSDGEWIDEESRIVTSIPVRLRLLEMVIADAAAEKLDRFIATL